MGRGPIRSFGPSLHQKTVCRVAREITGLEDDATLGSKGERGLGWAVDLGCLNSVQGSRRRLGIDATATNATDVRFELVCRRVALFF